MAIKSKDITKMYIEQIILSKDNNPDSWLSSIDNIPEAIWQSVCKHDTPIGYLFSVKSGIYTAALTLTLTLYLIKPLYCSYEPISLTDITDAYHNFMIKLSTTPQNEQSKIICFKNPPIDKWIDTKENWCKQIATKLTTKYAWNFDEALSLVYYTIMVLYNKPSVYIGNLHYIETSIYNNVKMHLRYNQNRLHQSALNSNKVVSLFQIVKDVSEDQDICLVDTLVVPDEGFNRLYYNELKRRCISLLEQSFSTREIEQILSQRAGYLPTNLYKRLAAWRQKHSSSEVLGD